MMATVIVKYFNVLMKFRVYLWRYINGLWLCVCVCVCVIHFISVSRYSSNRNESTSMPDGIIVLQTSTQNGLSSAISLHHIWSLPGVPNCTHI